MPFHRSIAASFVLAGALAAACGNSDATNRDFGEPPDPSKFNPGNGNSDPYGYGGPKVGASKVECPADLKRCGHTFTYPYDEEEIVEIRGDWDGQASWDKGVPMIRKGNQWTVEIPVPVGKPITFKFWVDGVPKPDPKQPKVTDPQGNENNTFSGAVCAEPTCSEEGQLPEGVFDWRDSVIYFVFVDRFFNGNRGNDGPIAGVDPGANYEGGDWAGVSKKIDENYFNDLGVNTLWVTVPFDNPNEKGKGAGGDTHQYSGYHGYWPMLGANASVLSTEEHFGSLAELKTLVSKAHAKGLKVLIDYAMVHVHSSSPIFQAHVPNVGGNPDDNWFWPNSKDGRDCVCGQGCSWDGDVTRCWFTDYLPHWNYRNADARNWSVTNAVEWVKQTADEQGNGVDGFRADAIKHVDISWLNALRTKLKSDIVQTPQQRFYMVGETYDFGNRDLLKSFIDPSTKLDGQFDFPLRKLLVESILMRTTPMSSLAGFMDTNDYFYGTNAVMSTFLGNHDLPRIIHVAANNRPWGDDQGADGKNLAWENKPGGVSELSAYERIANGFAVLFTNRGAPLVYYGDEIGLPGAGDPDNRRFMQWDNWSSNQTYLHDRIAVLAQIRAKHPALRRGTRSTITADNDTWVFSRETTGDKVYVAINRSDAPKEVSGLPSGALNDEVTSTVANGPTITIPARQARIFSLK